MKGSITLKCWNNYIKFDLYPNGVSLKSAIEEQTALCAGHRTLDGTSTIDVQADVHFYWLNMQIKQSHVSLLATY